MTLQIMPSRAAGFDAAGGGNVVSGDGVAKERQDARVVNGLHFRWYFI